MREYMSASEVFEYSLKCEEKIKTQRIESNQVLISETLEKILSKILKTASLGETYTTYYEHGGPVDDSGEDFEDIGEHLHGSAVRDKVLNELRSMGYSVCDSNKDHYYIISWEPNMTDEKLYSALGNW